MEGVLAVVGLLGCGIFACIYAILQGKKELEADIDEIEYLPMDPIPPPAAPIQPPVESNREKLYRVAKSCIGRDMSPKDLAPDSLACAESLNGVFQEAFGQDILKNVVGTSLLYNHMLTDKRFKEISHSEIQPGDISIAVTGQSSKNSPHGHVGVWGFENVMSNDSNGGIWRAHYTLAAWHLVFEKTLGFPLHAFRAV